MGAVRAQLENILSETPAAAREREARAFDTVCGDRQGRIVVFGAGNLGRRVCSGMRAAGKEPLAFSDNNSQLWGKEVGGIRILPPEEAIQRFGGNAVFVVSIWHPGAESPTLAVMRQLTRLGADRVTSFVPLFWQNPDLFLPYYYWDLPAKLLGEAESIREAFQLFKESESQSIFLHHLQLVTQADFDAAPRASGWPHYFPKGLFRFSDDEHFVDCGAYDGDTARELLRQNGSFRRLSAIEADPVNFHKLCEWKHAQNSHAQRIDTYQVAVGSRQGQLRFNATGGECACVSEDGNVTVESVLLDELLDGQTPTYIKMDIEGAELEALEGARQIIKKHQPILGICVYHKQSDLWRIPLFIRDLESSYSFFLRPHFSDSFDLVCYAVPPHRLCT